MTTPEDDKAIAAICARVPGWSDARQYGFFKSVLAARPDIEDMLMLGVYHGRDICYVQDILARYHPGRVLHIVGVDKFSNERCADWPGWAGSWEQVTHGMPAPDLDAADRNTRGGDAMVTLLKMDDVYFLIGTELTGNPNMRLIRQSKGTFPATLARVDSGHPMTSRSATGYMRRSIAFMSTGGPFLPNENNVFGVTRN